MAKKAHTLLIWRAVAAAGFYGLKLGEICAQLKHGVSKYIATSCLNNLHKAGYIERWGSRHRGDWVLTPSCKTPKGETRPEWLGAEPYETDEDGVGGDHDMVKPHRPLPGFETKVEMPVAPVWVFSLHALQACEARRL